MRRLILLIPLLLALAACGDGDKDGDGASAPADHAPRAEATATPESRGNAVGDAENAKDVLLRSARSSADVESMRGAFDMSMDFGGFDLSFEGETAFRAPDQMHMTMDLFGRDFEMLVYGSKFYMDVGGGWRSVDLTGVGINLDQFSQLWENRGLFDLEELAEAFGDDIVRLDDEVIDGRTYERYHVTQDPSGIADKLPEGLFDPELLEQVGAVIDDLESDFYIDPATDLVRRVSVSVDMDLPQGGEGSFAMTMDMLEYNGDVDIPPEPVGAPPLDPAELESTT